MPRSGKMLIFFRELNYPSFLDRSKSSGALAYLALDLVRDYLNIGWYRVYRHDYFNEVVFLVALHGASWSCNRGLYLVFLLVERPSFSRWFEQHPGS